jgi:cupin 2 domain-containing protein
MLKINNVFSGLNSAAEEEYFTELLRGRDFRLERIVSTGQATPSGEWYDQDWDEWVILLGGAATLEFSGDPRLYPLAPGDYLFIPAHCRHRVAWTAPGQASVWLALHGAFQAREAG